MSFRTFSASFAALKKPLFILFGHLRDGFSIADHLSFSTISLREISKLMPFIGEFF
jgi:hypothetical protein